MPLQRHHCWQRHRRPTVSSTADDCPPLRPCLPCLYISLFLSLSFFSLHPNTHSFHFHFGGNPFFLPFDFYNALFGDLGFVCLGFGLCLWALRMLGLHGCWFGLQICVIWAYILLDIVIGLIWISFIFVFLGVWTGVLALCWEWRNMEAIGAGEDRAWVELTEDQNFWIKKEKNEQKARGRRTTLETFSNLLCIFYDFFYDKNQVKFFHFK